MCKCWTANVCHHASKCPVIMMNQLKSIYNGLFKNLHSHLIHTRFPIFASNESSCFAGVTADSNIKCQRSTYIYIPVQFYSVNRRLAQIAISVNRSDRHFESNIIISMNVLIIEMIISKYDVK